MPWFTYKEVAGGYLPAVTLRLIRGDKKSINIPFLVDSGAAMSIVPQQYVGSLIADLGAAPAVDTGAKDANNNPVTGKWVDFDVELKGLSAIVQERVLVQAAPSYWGLLGQTWFEQIGARFENFAHSPQKRRFALHACPWPPPR